MTIIICIVIIILAVLCAILSAKEECSPIVTIFCGMMAVLFSCALYEGYTDDSIKAHLPEKIYEVKTGDTLIIQKRTKDTIYLEYGTK